MDSKSLSISELKDAFSSLKVNKSSGVSGIIFLFQRYPEKRSFTDDLKIVKVTSIYKADNSISISNHGPVTILPGFSKILERLMYNHLTIIQENAIFFMKNSYVFKEIFH